ncbi:cold shock and DUF1294 domain-containing protein [Luteimonas sp. 50]|uniref:Cold shock and DUF1294 domain-containing protein n=1 Tax=Cognatiluteimonas sedimenti TaxID=2927791 RepID=A0ABT0A2Q8_9GAMM|nr:cold shock and DUF1294 domain-containing protein [Lysobacter sedimenti]MCJ0825268.1 cold shock and DUF1294 domain-containing protein [Lysobacter sedimenti]
MRFVGRISGWNDDKGYGFVVPNGGGDRAFVHVKAFQFGSRRPVDGDLISYTAGRDARGRINATEVRFAGQRIEHRKPPLPIPRMLLGCAALLAIGLGAAFGWLPLLLAVAYGLASLLSYLMYSLDKSAARADAQRIPENSLHLADLLGGWPGALIAQQRFRHKTVKASFQFVFWCSVLGNLAIAAWLLDSGVARSLTDALL